MPAPSADELLSLLSALELLDPPGLDEARLLRAADGEAFSAALVGRGLLTAFQGERLRAGRGAELRLGPYVLLEALGRGGMGEVYKALDRKAGRTVALKLIQPNLLADPKAVERFRREILVTARLAPHPNVVTLHRAGVLGATHYLDMEYLDGTSLDRVVRQGGRLPVVQACGCALQAALGLQHAHEHGLVHRDVKPGNLMLTARGAPDLPDGCRVVKVLDFGLARFREATQGAPTLTSSDGAALGTIDFMAPEQALDPRHVDTRADIFSLGCTLFYLLTGSAPFPGETAAQRLLARQTRKAPPVRVLRADVPAPIEAVLARMLAREPDERYPVPGDVAAALRACLPAAAARPEQTALTLPYAPAPGLETSGALKAGGRRRVYLAAGLAAAVCAGLTAWLLSGGGEGGGTREVADGGPRVVVRPPGPENKEPVRGGEQKQPDGPARPADKVLPPDPPRGRRPWHPEGLCTVLGDERARLWAPVHAVAVSPDGKLFATSTATATPDSLIALWDADTREIRSRLTEKGLGYVPALAFAPDGKTLAAVSGGLSVHLWTCADGTWAKRAAVAPLWPPGTNQHFQELTFTPDGKTLCGRTLQGGLVCWDVTRPKPREMSPKLVFPRTWKAATVSGDGQLLAYSETDPETRFTAVRLKAVARGGEREVTLAVAQVSVLALTADGRRLAVNAGKELELWTLDGPKPRREAKVIARPFSVLRFSPDGTQLICTGVPGLNNSLWAWDVGNPPAGALVELKGHAGAVQGFAFGGNDLLASWGEDYAVRLWDRVGKGFRERPGLEGHLGVIGSVAFSGDGATLAAVARPAPVLRLGRPRDATPADRSQITLWDVRAGEGRVLPAIAGRFDQAAYAPRGGPLVACGVEWDSGAGGGRRGFVKVWERAGAEPQGLTFLNEISSLSLDGSGRRAALGASHAGLGVRLVQLQPLRQDGEPLQVGQADRVALSPDGKRLASPRNVVGSLRRLQVIQLLDVSDPEASAPKEVRRLQLGEGFEVGRLLFGPDGKVLAAVAATWGAVKRDALWLWDEGTDAGRVVSGAGRHPCILALAFAPDGRSVATAGADGRVALWEVSGGRQLHEWALPGPAHSLAFSPGGGVLATGNGNGTVYLLEVPAALRKAGR